MSDWHLASKNIPQRTVLSVAHLTVLVHFQGSWLPDEWQTNGCTGRLLQPNINQSVGSSINDLKQFPMPTLTYPTLAHERSMIEKSASLIGTLFVLPVLGKRASLVGKMWFPDETENCTFLLVQIVLVFA